jgi:glycosyltransferase involved in cell wall biosynthesis
MMLSVVIPIGNLGRDIENLKSIVSAVPKQEVELVLILDTAEKLAFIQLNELCKIERLNNYKILECADRNPGSSRNVGMNAAEGEWIIFCDSDDMPIFSNLLNTISLANDGSDIVIGSFFNEDNFGIRTSQRLIENDPYINWHLVSLNPGVWRWLMRKNLLEHVTFPKLSMGEDQFFLIKLLSTPSQIKFTSEFFYVYRTNTRGSLARNKAKLSDLSIVIKLEISYIRTIKFQNSTVNNMIFRQIVTLFKHGNIRLSILTLFLCMKFFLHLSLNEIFSVMKFAFRLIKDHN